MSYMPGSRILSDVVLAVFVMVIVAMLIIPLPTFLIDVFVVINVSFALLLLLVGLYMPNALSLLSFPTLLLLTTLFRLGLNVASTRLILSQGDAGNVIKAFGTFLVRGEILVGVIIFTIITIVNFIVIARGSSRVSVVAARFTLDSLPGKQAAIDADLRAGLIDNAQATSRREDLRKESQLYGSMDGAMQFVQGDAIAGFFITLTNIFGGIYLGVSKGQTFSDAINTYSILTIGDGLVTQIPAILISICAGIVVTRVASGERSTLSTDLSAQLFSNPFTLILAGTILLLLGLMPGLPFLPFLIVSLMFFITSALLKSSPAKHGEVRALLDFKGNKTLQPAAISQDGAAASGTENVKVLLDKSVGYRLYRQREANYNAYWDRLRSDFFNEVGMRLPDITVVPDDYLGSLEFSIEVGGSVVERENLVLDSVLVEVNPDFAYLYNLHVIKEASHPISQQRVFWAEYSAGLQQIIEAAGLRKYDFFEYIALRIAVFYEQNPQDLITISHVHAQLKQLEKSFPGFVGDVLARNFLDVPRLCDLLHMLVRQGVNVRDFKQIVEHVASYCATNSIGAADVDNAVLEDIVSFIRQARRRNYLTGSYGGSRKLRIVELSPSTEDLIEQMEAGEAGKSATFHSNLVASLSEVLRPAFNRGLLPVYLLARSDLRSNLDTLLRSMKIPLQIITYEEVVAGWQTERVALWEA